MSVSEECNHSSLDDKTTSEEEDLENYIQTPEKPNSNNIPKPKRHMKTPEESIKLYSSYKSTQNTL